MVTAEFGHIGIEGLGIVKSTMAAPNRTHLTAAFSRGPYTDVSFMKTESCASFLTSGADF